jgi:hypothetical protein
MNDQQPEPQPRRQSQRQRRDVDRLQLGEGVRAGQELPWQRMQRRRLETAAQIAERRARDREAAVDGARGIPQPPQAPPPAPIAAPPADPPANPPAPARVDPRPELEIIEEHRKYATKDKACNELTFLRKIPSRLEVALLSIFFGAPSELSKKFLNDADFELFISELNNLHSLNLPFDSQPVSVLSTFTSDLLRDLQTPFLFEFSVLPPVFQISRFLIQFFKNSLMSDQFLHRLAIFCFPEAARMKEDFIVGVCRSVFANAEVDAQKAKYFCLKCYKTFQEQAQLLSHVGHQHNWALSVNLTEGRSTAARNNLFHVNMKKWVCEKSLRTLVHDTDRANAHFAGCRQLGVQGLIDGQPHGDAAQLDEFGVHFAGQFIANPDSD